MGDGNGALLSPSSQGPVRGDLFARPVPLQNEFHRFSGLELHRVELVGAVAEHGHAVVTLAIDAVDFVLLNAFLGHGALLPRLSRDVDFLSDVRLDADGVPSASRSTPAPRPR